MVMPQVDIGGLMPKEIAIFLEPENTFYLVQKITTNDIYLRSKLITEFMEKETRKLEFVVSNVIKGILQEYGINIYSNRKVDYKWALDTLKTRFNKVIDIEDVYKDKKLENCEIIGVSKNDMTVVLEDNTYLQVGLSIKEVDVV